jgi:glycosyltransferase involved in cell wall biosynthesis
VLVISGATWDMLDIATLERLATVQGLRIVAVLADMIPWRFPHQFQDQGAVVKFRRFVEMLARHAALIVSISEATRQDLFAFAREHGIAEPRCEVIYLGADPPAADAAPPENLPEDFISREFVLSVSTLQVRKNHQLLYQLWRRFAEEGRTQIPRLVLVGSPGWLADDLRFQLDNDPLVKDSIIVQSHASDRQLSWFYKHAQFTLYPSLYEGWGLPIVESLQHGKACIASNTSSMPEAGQGLAMHLDPLDFPAWRRAILDWVENPKALAAANQTVRERYVPRPWSEFSQEFANRAWLLARLKKAKAA